MPKKWVAILMCAMLAACGDGSGGAGPVAGGDDGVSNPGSVWPANADLSGTARGTPAASMGALEV